MSKLIRGICILLIGVAVFLLLTLLIPFERTDVFWLSFAFGLVAIVSQAYVFYTAYTKGDAIKSRLYGYPIMKIGMIYVAVQVVLSFLFMALGSTDLDVDSVFWLPLLIFVILFGVFAIGLLAKELARDEIVRQDNALRTSVTAMRTLQSKAAGIAAQCAEPETKKLLTELAEKFRYSDPTSSEATEGLEKSLFAAVNDLQRAVGMCDYSKAVELAGIITNGLAERNRVCKLSKGS